MADTPARMIRNTTRSMMMTVGRSGSSLAINLLPFTFPRTGRWLRLMRFSGSTKSFSVREAARSCAAYDLFCSIVKVFLVLLVLCRDSSHYADVTFINVPRSLGGIIPAHVY